MHRSAANRLARAPENVIHRAAEGGSSLAEAARSQTPTLLIAEDEAKNVAPNQMRKSPLPSQFCAARSAPLPTPRWPLSAIPPESCPYIEKWLGFYEKQSGAHIEMALHKYAPETATARNAQQAIRLVAMRAQRAALAWAKPGRIEGMPPELARQMSGAGGPGNGIASSGMGGAILGFFGGSNKQKDEMGAGGVLRKARSGEEAPAHDAAAVKSQLGSEPLSDSGMQSRMSSAFGLDYSGVRCIRIRRPLRFHRTWRRGPSPWATIWLLVPANTGPAPLPATLIAHELAHGATA